MSDITSKLRSALAESAFAGLAVVIAATDCTYAADEIDRLRAELSGYVEANRYMKGELDDALEDARKYAEAQREIARLGERLDAALSQSSLFGDALHTIVNRCDGMANRIARAALSQESGR